MMIFNMKEQAERIEKQRNAQSELRHVYQHQKNEKKAKLDLK